MKSKKYNRKRVSESRRVSRQYRRKMSGGENIYWWKLQDIHMYIGKKEDLFKSSTYYVSNVLVDSKSSRKIDDFITHYYNGGKLIVYNPDNKEYQVDTEYNGEVYIEQQYDRLYEDTVLYQIATNRPPAKFKDLHKLAVEALNDHKAAIGRRIDNEHNRLPINEKLEHTKKYIANNYQLSLPFPYRM